MSERKIPQSIGFDSPIARRTRSQTSSLFNDINVGISLTQAMGKGQKPAVNRTRHCKSQSQKQDSSLTKKPVPLPPGAMATITNVQPAIPQLETEVFSCKRTLLKCTRDKMDLKQRVNSQVEVEVNNILGIGFLSNFQDSERGLIDFASEQRNSTLNIETSRNHCAELAEKICCPICFEPLSSIQAATPSCGHVFCEKCLEDIAIVTKKCAICRRPITLEEIIRLKFSSH